MTDPKIVWVVGAGFSRSLGGPLLNDLLSVASYQEACIRYPECGFDQEESRWALRLYGHGSRHRFGRLDPHAVDAGTTLWADAESFLDYLDLAARDSSSVASKRIDVILRNLGCDSKDCRSPSILRQAATRLVAAECCGFLDGADKDQEKWIPYRRWARVLTKSDTVVSFNYDRVVETLTDNVDVILPHHLDAQAHQDCPRLLKLHGSVDWKRCTASQGKVRVETAAATFATSAAYAEAFMATPGPSKRETAHELRALWVDGMRSIREAASLVFVGYRFPPSDAQAREELLRAVEENNQQLLVLHVVLGPDVDGAKRLATLLSYVCERAGRVRGSYSTDSKGYVIQVHPLYAEDFFTVVQRDALASM